MVWYIIILKRATVTWVLSGLNMFPLNSENVWFQKISIPPPRRELEIPKGRGGQRLRKFQGEGGVV